MSQEQEVGAGELTEVQRNWLESKWLMLNLSIVYCNENHVIKTINCLWIKAAVIWQGICTHPYWKEKNKPTARTNLCWLTGLLWSPILATLVFDCFQQGLYKILQCWRLFKIIHNISRLLNLCFLCSGMLDPFLLKCEFWESTLVLKK